MIIRSKVHKAINGHVDGEPFSVLFDEDGYADVDETVGDQLLRLGSAEAVPDQTDVTDIHKMNPAQLKKYAKDNGIEIGSATKKAELLALIEKVNSGDGGAGDGDGNQGTEGDQTPQGDPQGGDNE